MAQYAAVHFPEFLKSVSSYSDGSLATALENAFLGFDATLVTEDVKKQLKVLAAGDEKAAENDENDEESMLISTACINFFLCDIDIVIWASKGMSVSLYKNSTLINV